MVTDQSETGYLTAHDNASAGFTYSLSLMDASNQSGASGDGHQDFDSYRSDITGDFVATILTFIFGSIGNIFALIVLFRSPQDQRKSVFYILVACLVVTDLFGLLSSSTVLIGIHRHLFTLSTVALCQFFSFALVFSRLTTVLLIGAMAVDRYLSLHCPYMYSRYFDHTRAVHLVGFIFVFAFAFALLPIVGVGRYVLQYPGTWCFFCRYGASLTDLVYASLFSALGLVVIVLLVVCNVSAITTLIRIHFRHRRLSYLGTRRTSQNEDSTIERKEEHREIQMAVLLAGIAVAFTTCWGPILVSKIVHVFLRRKRTNSGVYN